MSKRWIGAIAAAVAGLGIAAVLAASPAAAQDPNQLSLSPATVAPGGSVKVTMSCEAAVDNARATWSHGSVSLTTPGNEPVYHGTLNVPANTRPGTYQVDSNCGRATLTVSPRGAPQGGTGLETDNTSLVLAGAGVLVVAGLAGAVLLGRRDDARAR